MTTKMSGASTYALAQRTYADLAGVDFCNIPSQVALNRSPDALNIYKNYLSTNGQAIETRPGITNLGATGSTVYGLHILDTKCLIHHGTNLSKWDTFPSAIEDSGDLTLLRTSMNEATSTSFVFGDKLYISDGVNYLVYDGTTLSDVTDDATIPTTRIAADPDGGNGELYQEINLLSPYRDNSFIGDGSSTDYYLDATGLDDSGTYTMQAWINGSLMTEGGGFSVNRTTGVVTFSSAPPSPSTTGTDNVIIRYSKTVSANTAKIENCTITKTFDNRVFFSGNENYPGMIFHSELDDPAYIRETAYYIDGEDSSNIKALVRGSGMLIVVKEDDGGGAKVFIHTPSLNSTIGKIYPVTSTEISLGAIGFGINFFDDIVFLSPMGLEGLRFSESSVALDHRSTMVDRKLISETDLKDCQAAVWNNYLLLLINGKTYLADHRQVFRGEQSAEYEWYVWDNIGVYESDTLQEATVLTTYEGELYIGCENGDVAVFDNVHDEGRLIESYWTTPPDDFGAPARLKSVIRRGGIAQIKRIPNSVIKLDVQTDKESWVNELSTTSSGFTFEEGSFSFADLSFGTGVRGRIQYRFNRRRIKDISLKFYSDEIGKPFGLYEATLQAAIMNYTRK